LSGDTSHFNSVSRENVLSLKEKDLIEKLPGQPSGISFRQYGGYVAVNEPATRFLYYYFVEAIKPSKSTPLVLWFNGGTSRKYISPIQTLFIGITYRFFKIQLDSSNKNKLFIKMYRTGVLICRIWGI